MINPNNVGILLGIVALETLSQTFAKEFYDANHDRGVQTDGTKNFYLVCFSLALYVVVLFLLLKSYDYSDFAITNAFWDSGTIVGTALVGYFYFGERFKWQELMGMGFVITGALLLGAYSEDVSKRTD
jgi:multidrug transporter EmrE-like cation transporter